MRRRCRQLGARTGTVRGERREITIVLGACFGLARVLVEAARAAADDGRETRVGLLDVAFHDVRDDARDRAADLVAALPLRAVGRDTAGVIAAKGLTGARTRRGDGGGKADEDEGHG